MAAAVARALPQPETSEHLDAAAIPLSLLREIGDLKRVTSAGRKGSIATRLFQNAWSALVQGEDPRRTALSCTAEALAAARLGDLDASMLLALGLSQAEAASVRAAALDEIAADLPRDLRDELRDALAHSRPPNGTAPPFVGQLAAQPRAGATCPGKPRIVLQPAESHAEHCLVVAVYGVLLGPSYGADPGKVFLAALAHHLHNAALPDSGFTGEMLLGPYLEGVMARANAAALAELAPPLRAEVDSAREILPDATTAEGRAFHAADVLDRVLEIEQHLRAARLGMGEVLGDMALVHEGPVKGFHDGVLREFGIL